MNQAEIARFIAARRHEYRLAACRSAVELLAQHQGSIPYGMEALDRARARLADAEGKPSDEATGRQGALDP